MFTDLGHNSALAAVLIHRIVGPVTALSRVMRGRAAERTAPPSARDCEIAHWAGRGVLANMSHELRTPLNSIIGFSDALRSGAVLPVEARVQSYCDDIYQAGGQLRAIIDNLLDFAEIEAGHAEPRLEAVDAAELIADCAAALAAAALAAGVGLHHDRLEGLPAVAADRKCLRQIIANLLGNAVKFTPPGGSVTVTATAGREALRIAVVDTGIGIAPEHVDRVAEPFYQVKPVASRDHGGVGLGLTLVHRMVSLHHGRLEIASRRGEGTAVVVSLPWAA